MQVAFDSPMPLQRHTVPAECCLIRAEAVSVRGNYLDFLANPPDIDCINSGQLNERAVAVAVVVVG